MKKIFWLVLAAGMVLGLAGCKAAGQPAFSTEESPPSTAAPNTVPFSFVSDGVLYRNTGKTMEIEVDESEYLGKITSSVSMQEYPTEDGQANFNAEGAPYISYEEGMALWVGGQWILFQKWRKIQR